MAERIMLRLGDFNFEIATAAYQQYMAKHAARWPAQERLNRPPALQYVGPDAPDITLNGVVYPGFNGSGRKTSIVPLRTLLAKGQPLLLVTGVGNVCGKWVITDVSDTRSLFLDNGEPRKIEFTLSLKYYGADAGNTGQGAALAAAQRPGAGALPETADFLTRSAGAAAALEALDLALSALPAITEEATLSEVGALTSVVTGLTGVLSDAADLASSAIDGALRDLAGAAREATELLPASVLSSLRDLRGAAGLLADLGGGVADTASAVSALAYTGGGEDPGRVSALSRSLRRDVRHIHSALDVSRFGLGGMSSDLRSTASTFGAVAEISDPDTARSRRAVADACSGSADCAEHLVRVCERGSSTASLLLQKFKLEEDPL